MMDILWFAAKTIAVVAIIAAFAQSMSPERAAKPQVITVIV